MTISVNTGNHLLDFVYACIYITVLYFQFMFFVRKIKDMVHLYDFMEVTAPQQFFTFVTGPLLEIIE